eukprot:1136128-Rhodomonas_salina.1
MAYAPTPCYAISGTDIAYGSYAPWRMLLRPCCAVSGTDLAYSPMLSAYALATRCPVLFPIALRTSYAMCGTDLEYGATVLLCNE